jgi:hypothetical protein
LIEITPVAQAVGIPEMSAAAGGVMGWATAAGSFPPLKGSALTIMGAIRQN